MLKYAICCGKSITVPWGHSRRGRQRRIRLRHVRNPKATPETASSPHHPKRQQVAKCSAIPHFPPFGTHSNSSGEPTPPETPTPITIECGVLEASDSGNSSTPLSGLLGQPGGGAEAKGKQEETGRGGWSARAFGLAGKCTRYNCTQHFLSQWDAWLAGKRTGWRASGPEVALAPFLRLCCTVLRIFLKFVAPFLRRSSSLLGNLAPCDVFVGAVPHV